MASKYEEIYPPALNEFTYVCASAYTDNDLLDMEQKILETINFNMVYTSCYSLLTIFSNEGRYSSYLEKLKGPTFYATEYLLHLSQLEISLSKIRPSKLVAGAIYCSY